MSRKELLRAGLVKAALARRITNRQGATSLRLSVRQFQRLKRRLETGGDAALRHRSRGQPSAHRLPAGLRTKVTTLMSTVYAGFNDVHLTEKLREVEQLPLSRESVRRLRLAAGRPAQRPRRAPRYRRRRTPAAAAGALVQTDGSPFAWLEDRGPRLTLLGVIDDATGQILALRFREAEDLHGYTGLFHEVFTIHGLPLAVYGDRLNVFVRNDRHWTLEEQLAGQRHPTHLGRMFQDLGISYISAHSPQAKGRIERLWATLQDRLASELRLRGLKTPAAAEAYLPEFIADFNARFAHPPATTPALLAPPATRSRARAELSLHPRRRARPYDPPRRAPGAAALPRARARLRRAARGGSRTPRRPPRRPARRAGARDAAQSGARLRPHATPRAVHRATGTPPATGYRDAKGAHRACAGRDAASGGAHDGSHPRRGEGRAPRRRSNARSPGRLLCRYPRTRPKFPACAVAPRAFAPVATCGDVGGRGQETPEADTPRGMTFSRSSKG